MIYTETANNVTLNMTHRDYEQLLLALGMALGSALQQNDSSLVPGLIQFVNELNRTNPHFTPLAFMPLAPPAEGAHD